MAASREGHDHKATSEDVRAAHLPGLVGSVDFPQHSGRGTGVAEGGGAPLHSRPVPRGLAWPT